MSNLARRYGLDVPTFGSGPQVSSTAPAKADKRAAAPDLRDAEIASLKARIVELERTRMPAIRTCTVCEARKAVEAERQRKIRARKAKT